jgi:hypothetical protein
MTTVTMQLLGAATQKVKPRWVAASELGSERVSMELAKEAAAA